MLTETWTKIIEALMAEAASPLEKLLNFITRRFGEHEADQVQSIVQQGASGNPAEMKNKFHLRYQSPEIDALVKDVVNGPEQKAKPAPSEPGKRGPKSKEPEEYTGHNRDKGSSGAEAIPQRPDRAGVGMNLGGAQSPTGGGHKLEPGKASTSPVGTAGQNQPHVQPSVAAMPNLPKSARIRNGQSTIKQTLKMDPDKAYAQDVDKLPKTGAGHRHKPPFKGTVIGQRWSPNAYSAPDKGNPEKGIEPEKDTTAGRRAMGFMKKMIQRPNAATGQMQRGGLDQNPAKPQNIKMPGGGSWADTHDVVWAGDNYGWVNPSEFATLAATGKVKRDRRDAIAQQAKKPDGK